MPHAFAGAEVILAALFPVLTISKVQGEPELALPVTGVKWSDEAWNMTGRHGQPERASPQRKPGPPKPPGPVVLSLDMGRNVVPQAVGHPDQSTIRASAKPELPESHDADFKRP